MSEPLKILLCDRDPDWCREAGEFLVSRGLEVDACSTGKDCQLAAYKKAYHALILDYDVVDHSGAVVLRYMKQSHARVAVVVTFRDKAARDASGVSEEDFKRQGARAVLVKPLNLQALFEELTGDTSSSWRNVRTNEGPASPDVEVDAADKDFTSIKISAVQSGNTTLFDHYIRMGQGKYVKILHKGDLFDEARLKRYAVEKGVEYLYFRTSDRAAYLNFTNQLLETAIATDRGDTGRKIQSARTASEKYIEEIYTTGFRPQIVEEGHRICQNMYELVQKDKNVAEVMRRYADYDPPEYAHLFLSSFISTIIAKNLEWTSARTVESVAMAGLLHDIGKLRLPRQLLEKKITDMTTEELVEFQKHPVYGVEMLRDSPLISEPVRQIIHQHHESMTGDGFPNKLSGLKIYPLARILALANEFADLLIERRITPLDGLREFIPDRSRVARFDPAAVKALVSGFLKDK